MYGCKCQMLRILPCRSLNFNLPMYPINITSHLWPVLQDSTRSWIWLIYFLTKIWSSRCFAPFPRTRLLQNRITFTFLPDWIKCTVVVIAIFNINIFMKDIFYTKCLLANSLQKTSQRNSHEHCLLNWRRSLKLTDGLWVRDGGLGDKDFLEGR